MDVRGVGGVNSVAEGPTAEGEALIYVVGIDEVEGVDVRDIDEVNDAAEMVEVRDGVWLVMV